MSASIAGVPRAASLSARGSSATRQAPHIKASTRRPRRQAYDRLRGCRSVGATSTNLHGGTVAVLEEHRRKGERPGEWVVGTHTGEPFNTTGGLNRYVKPCLVGVKPGVVETTEKGNERTVSRFRRRDLRHPHATMLLGADVDPEIVSKRLGHASVTLILDTSSRVVLPGLADDPKRGG